LFLRIGEPIATWFGIALFVLPLLGLWALVAELVFAVRAERLAAELEADGEVPEEELPLRPSGRGDPEAAKALFPGYRLAVEAAPEDWRAWFRLALAYDGAGDRRRARWAVREAIRLRRDSPRG